MIGKKLAVLGASYLQLPLVKKAKEKGLKVHCFAWDDGKAVCKDIADSFYPISVLEKDEILLKCKKIGINGILTIATDICVPTIAYVAEKLKLSGNSLGCALSTTNKSMMRKLLVDNNKVSPRSVSLSKSDISEIECILKINKLDYPLIVKPSDRSGSLGVTKVLDMASLNNAVLNAINYSLEKKCVVEEFIIGREVSVETLSFRGEHKVLAITDKITTNEPYFVELAHHQPANFDHQMIEKIEREAVSILDVFGVHNGAGHLEFRINNSGNIFLIEIGSRMGGDFIGSHLVKLSTGFDYLNAVIDISLNDFKWEDISPLKHNYSGVYFLSKETDRLLPYFQKEYFADFIVEREILNNNLKSVTSSNDRSGYLIYSSERKIVL